MDREITKEEKRRIKRKQILKISSICLAIIIVIGLAIHLVSKSIPRSSFSLSTVTKGDLVLSYAASGVIAPAFEEVINSPINSKILEVYKRSGDAVDVGTPLLKLDLQDAQTDLSKAIDESNMKKCELEQLRLNNTTQLSDLRMHVKVAQMKFNRMTIELRNEKYLDSLGSGTTDKVREVEMNLRTGKLELEQLKEQYRNEQLVKAADVKSKQLEYNIMVKNIANIRRTLTDAQIRSPRRAVLSYINNQLGAQVSQGSKVAMVADTRHFKVNCEIADTYASRIAVGGLVLVRLGSKQFEGIITNLTPLSQNGVIDFTVQLKKDDDATLRSGLKADVYVLSSTKSDILRITNGPYYKNGSGDYEMFVLDGNNRLTRRTVQLGDCSFEYVEVVKGLKPGEQVVVSDMSDFQNNKKIRITEQ